MEVKTVGIACDHAGFPLKQFVLEYLEKKGYPVKDYGTYSDASVDYPDFGHALANGIESGEVYPGIGGCGQNGRANNGEMNMNVNIDLYTALLGGEGIIKLSNGSKIKLKIKPETQNGTKVRVRGKGYDRGDGTFGDLMITYNVKLPTGLNDKQKDLLRQMKDAK